MKSSPAPKRNFYCALQCVSSGLCKKLSDYPGYNSFNDASKGIARKLKVFNFGRFNALRRTNTTLEKKDFIETFELRYERLPNKDALSDKEYLKALNSKLEILRAKEIKDRFAFFNFGAGLL